jgi:hypothetical protein
MELDSDFFNDDLSSAMGTDALVAMVWSQQGSKASSGKRPNLLIQLINGGAMLLTKAFHPIAWWSKETLLSIRK